MSFIHFPAVSVVVPVYNEVSALTKTDSFSSRIKALLCLFRPCDEIVLVDGGSTDASWTALQELARQHSAVTVLQSQKGRAQQMNRGAAQAKGDVFLFLHADTVFNQLAWNALLACIVAQFAQGATLAWGRFDVRIEGRSFWLPMVAWFMNQRSRLGKMCTGDQALFVSRDLFHQVSGFPEQPLMEDIELCKRLKRMAPTCFFAIRAPVLTSGRRWDIHGAWATILLMWRIRFNYWRGVCASQLACQYADARQKLPTTIAVFAKYPQPGRVKTRLEPLLGPEHCAAFARYLLLSTLDKLQGLNVVLWTDGGTQAQWAELLNGRQIQRHIQPNGHLGVRMQTAVKAHLHSSEVVVLLGPDAVQFTLADLKNLERAARQQALAFIPALDGGYVALACTHCVPAIFSESIDWGTDLVAEQTKAALREYGLQSTWFEPQMDIDEPCDLQRAIQLGCVPTDWANT